MARRLEAEGIDARALSMHTLKPLDSEAVIRAARETGVIVTIEEHRVTGGLGSAVAEVLAESGINVKFRRFGVPDEVRHAVGSQTHLRSFVLCGSCPPRAFTGPASEAPRDPDAERTQTARGGPAVAKHVSL